MSKIKVNTEIYRISNYISDFEKGKLQIPIRTNDFVWNNQQKLDLFDSIKKGYPIGSILIWQPSDFPYILDGFHRLSTLLGNFINPISNGATKLKQVNSDMWEKEFDIYYDLELDTFDFYKKNDEYQEIHKVNMYKFLDVKEFYYFQKQLFNTQLSDKVKDKYLERFEYLSEILYTCEIPIITIKGGIFSDMKTIMSRLKLN